jgi:hypothetical protein
LFLLVTQPNPGLIGAWERVTLLGIAKISLFLNL